MMEDSRKALEHIFANNFSSPVFPILADIYCKNKEYERALKVCSIGLNNDPDNFTGQFILSKIYLAMKNEKEAERILKNVVAKDSNNIEALILLIKLEKKLSRSINTIKKYIKDAYAKTPNNKFIKKEFKSLIQANKSNKKQKKATTSQVIVKPKTIIIDDAMATKTMYQLMKTQKKYDIAISILNRMKQKKINEDFVVTEFDELRPLIKNKEF